MSLGRILIIISCFIFTSCAKLKDYISTERGFLNVRIKKSFGQGEDIKNYYVTDEGFIINRGDSKEYVYKILGRPENIKTSLEGEEFWTYEERKLEIYFDDGYVRSIVFKDRTAKEK
ncbi:MAG: outer membrane protein assembly factor BamE [Candidatus Omnitrophica bacterium]|nr:outer membrane protein assembly factor BamE [Candidatus Omnitrophota bacterium]